MTLAICIASGASLTAADVDRCKGISARVYAVKESYLLAPFANVLYCADDDWWDAKHGVPEFAGAKWTVSDAAAKKWGINHVNGTGDIAWGKTPELIAYGGNSGFQAMNLAYVQGARKIILLGYDYKLTETRKHWYDGTPHARTSRQSDYAGWLARLNEAATQITIPIINCSRDSAIECFQKMPLCDAFATAC